MELDANEYRRRMNMIIAAEANAINRTFEGCQMAVRTRPGKTRVAGRNYISYELESSIEVRPEQVEKLLSKLTDVLYKLRNQNTKEKRTINLRLSYQPLALEINHPKPEPLDWRRARTLLRPDTMLTGRDYSGEEPTDDVLSLADMAHVLAVGMTGSGKTTLLRMMISTLALNTDPDLCRMYIVDPKMEDFLPFERLPHCEMFAGRQDVTRAIAAVRDILAARQDTRGAIRRSTCRVVS